MGVENNPQFMIYETSSSDEDNGPVNLNQVYNNLFVPLKTRKSGPLNVNEMGKKCYLNEMFIFSKIAIENVTCRNRLTQPNWLRIVVLTKSSKLAS